MLTRYDLMNGRELKEEFVRRYGTSLTKRVGINKNASGWKFRVFFTQEDLKQGLNPYINLPSHNSSSPEASLDSKEDEPSPPSVKQDQ